MSIETLSTPRLLLKEIKAEHIADYQNGFADYDVIRHMNSRVPWPYPKTGAKDFLESTVFPHQGKTIWQWGIFQKQEPEKLIGSISLRKSDVDNRGFWLAKAYWGHGFMTEATDAATRYAFENLGFTILRFTNAKGNTRSARIKEKQGARYVKTVPLQAVDHDYREAEHWELTKDMWREQQKSEQKSN